MSTPPIVLEPSDYILLRAMQLQLTPEEGDVTTPYTDTTGNLTIGIGHNLKDPISQAAVAQIFRDDVAPLLKAVPLLFPTTWKLFGLPRQCVLVDVAFNEGLGGLEGFTAMRACLTQTPPDYVGAAGQLLDSDAARELPDRYGKLATQLQTGVSQF
jgi:GH24 family phage-related lysozyme (muramidase)